MRNEGHVWNSAYSTPTYCVTEVAQAVRFMDSFTQYRDADLRIRLLEYIARTYSGVEHFAALEARYAANERRADVLVISDHSHAYEIKSDVDRLDRLPEQLKDYRRTFDFLTVVTTQTHACKVKKMLGGNDGLIVISDQEAREVRPPKRNKKIAKKNMVSMCSKSVLIEALDVGCGTLPLEKVRTLAERKLPLVELRQATFQELRRRFKDKYDVFLEEACIPYRESDLTLLQHNDRLFTNLLLT